MDHPKTSDAYDVGPYGTVRYGREKMSQHEHPLADGADPVEPGMLVERVNEGGDIAVQRHSTAGSLDNVYVAIEARGRGMNALDGEYAEGADEYVRYVAVKGGGLNLLLASGENVDIGDSLTSGGDGTLIQYVDADHDDSAFEVAAPVDNSGGDAAVFVPSEVM